MTIRQRWRRRRRRHVQRAAHRVASRGISHYCFCGRRPSPKRSSRVSGWFLGSVCRLLTGSRSLTTRTYAAHVWYPQTELLENFHKFFSLKTFKFMIIGSSWDLCMKRKKLLEQNFYTCYRKIPVLTKQTIDEYTFYIIYIIIIVQSIVRVHL